MKKSFVAAVTVVALLGQAEAADLTFLTTPYQLLDSIVMTFYKPLIWLVVIGWSQNFACSAILDTFIDSFITSNTLTDDEADELCKDGIKMYWEQFYYGGDVDNRPYDLGWDWEAS
jgi:hypothetical protein